MKIAFAYCEKDGFVLRHSKPEDAKKYFDAKYVLRDEKIAQIANFRSNVTFEMVASFLKKNLQDNSRYDFFLVSPEKDIVGECVIHKIDYIECEGLIRLAIFQAGLCGKGLGTWMLREVCKFAFEELKLNCLNLVVLRRNLIAIGLYQKIGFKENRALQRIMEEKEEFLDEIWMSLTREEWEKAVKRKFY